MRQLLENQRGRCAYFSFCGRRLSLADPAQLPHSPELDHKTPRAAGGDSSFDNLQWLCRSCNQAKGQLNDAQFRRAMEIEDG